MQLRLKKLKERLIPPPPPPPKKKAHKAHTQEYPFKKHTK